MDHETTREQLELAALEPDGLDRLMAGDTAAAQAVAAHLAGCPSCTGELVRLQRASRLIREVVREMPPADLRERTLATVAAVGITRAAPGPAAPSVSAGGDAARSAEDRARALRRRLLATVATIAAAVVLSVASTLAIVVPRVEDRLAAHGQTIAAVGDVTVAAMSIAGEPDAALVTLTGTTDPEPEGRLSFSPSTTQVAIIATGLAEPLAGQEYRCWVEIEGKRQRVGLLSFSDGIAYWEGPAPAVADIAGPAIFGVSLVDAAASGGVAPTVLLGEL